MAGALSDWVIYAGEAMSAAGCTPIARVKAARGVMDMVFFTTSGACILIRCSTRKDYAADLEALTTIHMQRTFDHVVLLRAHSAERQMPPSIISFAELAERASDLAKLQPGWAI